MKLTFRCVMAVVMTTALAWGCSVDVEDDESSSTGSSGSNGVTDCGSAVCQACQYCFDETFNDCSNGCLSNTNCAGDQTCQKGAGEDVGSCQNNGGGHNCAALCTKLQACDPSVTQGMCDQFCAGTNATCQQCILDANCSDETACDSECSLGG